MINLLLCFYKLILGFDECFKMIRIVMLSSELNVK
jgi:hypothetical protein